MTKSINTAFTHFEGNQHWRPEDRMDDSFPKVYFEAGYKAGVESTLPTEQEARPMSEPSELDYSCSRLTELANIAHSGAKANGWWDKGDRNIGELFMLMVTELAEGYEAHRNNDAMDDHLPDVPGVHAELADTIIRILDFCGKEKIPIGEIVRRKIEYNKTRGYRHGGKRA
jgi:hypothetical protein